MAKVSRDRDDLAIQQQLDLLLGSAATHRDEIKRASTAQRRRLQRDLEQAILHFQELLQNLDPIKMPPHVLDPSDPEVVGQVIARTLLVQERHALRAVSKFYGSGVYALYYSGTFDAYQPISGTEDPIYVGKADPAMHGATSPIKQGVRLWSRLNDHKRSIEQAQNLHIDDFDCRFLVVKSAWQGTAENYLISLFTPIWNNETKICYGFGKHGDDSDTRANTRSPWDTLHPGRPWAMKQTTPAYSLTAEEIALKILEHFRVKSTIG